MKHGSRLAPRRTPRIDRDGSTTRDRPRRIDQADSTTPDTAKRPVATGGAGRRGGSVRRPVPQRPPHAHSTASAATGEILTARRAGVTDAASVMSAAAPTTIATTTHGTDGTTKVGSPSIDPSIDCAPSHP